MLLWLKANLATILISLVIIAVVFFIVRSMVRDKKAGRSSCGGNCANCGGCHTAYNVEQFKRK